MTERIGRTQGAFTMEYVGNGDESIVSWQTAVPDNEQYERTLEVT